MKHTYRYFMLAALMAGSTAAQADNNGRIGFSGYIVDANTTEGARVLRDQALRDVASLRGRGLALPRDSDAVFASLQQAAHRASGQAFDGADFAFALRPQAVTADGYPAFALRCDLAQQQCHNTDGLVIGTLRAVAEQLPPVRNRDVLRRDWQCEHVCLDATGTVVGAVQAPMLAWLQAHPEARFR